jgi:hypothetical protein
MTGHVNTNIVSVNSTATLIVPTATGRRDVIIIQESNTLVRLGGANVTTSNGVPLPNTMYSTITITGHGAVYGIVATGTANVSFLETY